MSLDYRCYIKFRNLDILNSELKKIFMQDRNGKDHSIFDIMNIFVGSNGAFGKMHEPIGDIFDNIILNRKKSYIVLHDNRRSSKYYDELTQYIVDALINTIPNDFILIADYTDFDTNIYGDITYYYFGKMKSKLYKYVVDDVNGLIKHDEDITKIKEFLGEKYTSLTNEERSFIDDILESKPIISNVNERKQNSNSFDYQELIDLVRQGNETVKNDAKNFKIIIDSKLNPIRSNQYSYNLDQIVELVKPAADEFGDRFVQIVELMDKSSRDPIKACQDDAIVKRISGLILDSIKMFDKLYINWGFRRYYQNYKYHVPNNINGIKRYWENIYNNLLDGKR